MRKIKFYKYEAAGNDFIIIESETLEELITLAPQMCDRHFGIGADGVLVISQTVNDAQSVHAGMHVINADGTLAEMCGNGIRCVACHLTKTRNLQGPLLIATRAGVQTVRPITHENTKNDTIQFEVAMSKVQIGSPLSINLNGQVWSGTFVDVGNPHAVFEVSDPNTALQQAGHALSNHKTFPDRCNIEFITPCAPQTLKLTVYERGVGPTLACGTGCVAAATAYAKNHDILGKTLTIHAPGGILHVITSTSASTPTRLQGGAQFVFEGFYNT